MYFSEKSVTSDSSGVCTSNSAASYESGQEQHVTGENLVPGNTCVCIADYNSMLAGHLQLCSGDTVESKYLIFFHSCSVKYSINVNCLPFIFLFLIAF